MKIPIDNLYYLLCYAWNKLEEGKKIYTDESDYDDLINLLSRVLVNGCNNLFKRGMDSNYIEITEGYSGIKGKINFGESLKSNTFQQGVAICQFDQFSGNILPNQLLKATLLRLMKIKGVSSTLKNEILPCYRRFHLVDNITIRKSDFYKVRIHRNNSFYDLLLKICKLIIDNTVLDSRTGAQTFREFTGSDQQMGQLFEEFVRNFLKREQTVFEVSKEKIKWNVDPALSTSLDYLPLMETDISLESTNRKIIIETKFYSEALISRHELEKLRSSHLYQLYAYLKNIETKEDHPQNPYCEGMLLYPTVNYSLNEWYQMGRHLVKVKTIDLSVNWKEIRANLLKIHLER